MGAERAEFIMIMMGSLRNSSELYFLFFWLSFAAHMKLTHWKEKKRSDFISLYFFHHHRIYYVND